MPKKKDALKLALELPVSVLDIETRQTAQDVGGWKNKGRMKISVAVIYDSATNEHHAFGEEEVGKLVLALYKAKVVVGFNLLGFDYHVLHGSMQRAHNLPVEIAWLRNQDPSDWPKHITTIDLHTLILKEAGHRVSLDALALGTLKEGKLGDGLLAVDLWKEGKLAELADYCTQDVDLTYKLYLWGLKMGTCWWINKHGKVKWCPAPWKAQMEQLALLK